MTKLLRVGDYILIAAAAAGEIYDNFRLVGDLVPKAYELKYGFVPSNFKRNSYFSSVSKLLSTGEIKREIDSKGQAYIELTAKGNEKFKRKFPILYLQKQKWDGNFMIVMFDIEEKQHNTRNLLRNKLKELGFGMLQESVFVSPYHFEEDFREFIETRNLQKNVYVLNARVLGVGNNLDLVNKVWKLSEINKKYGSILDKAILEHIDLTDLWERYFRVAILDPMLPIELLPDDWKQKQVVKTLQKLSGR